MLGDKMLEIDPGRGESRPELGGDLAGEDPTDYSNIVGQVGVIAERTNAVLGNLDKVSATIADDKVREDLRSSIQSVNIILKSVAEGDGYVSRLLTDPQEAERLSRTVASLEKTSTELAVVASEVRQLVSRVNRGPGFVHSVVYDNAGTETVNRFGEAAGEVALALRGVREGNGMAKALLYGGGGDEAELVSNLRTASADLRDILSGIKKGKGTVGALLVDPSVYEDMKVLLGNVQRNDVLRALVRYSIKQDDVRPTVDVKDPEPTVRDESR
jgi:phospholipid/cholesterol/gamma-HCH transport system substrate-binding protein